MPLVIDKKKCPQNHTCPMIAHCPVSAIIQQGFELPQIDSELCIKCGKCVKICGMKAVYKVDLDGKTV
ncbi:MAG: 4Fe-4S binding protein [Phocaeicola sp.]